jgi:protein O-GlcNAc transferase
MDLQTLAADDLLRHAQQAMNDSRWSEAHRGFLQALSHSPQRPQLHHNLALCALAMGQPQAALASAQIALQLMPSLWQSRLVVGHALAALKKPEAADDAYASVLQWQAGHGEAILARADLAMNVFGCPVQAAAWVQPLLSHPQHAQDAQLTLLMASVYDRDITAHALSQAVMKFSGQHLRLPCETLAATARPRLERRAGPSGLRPRVALISPHFSASPVYFLTIAGWRHVAAGSDIVVFNRGHQRDWATEQFKALAHEWIDVQALPAEALAQRIHAADIDVLYDLGGWMDPVALKALSCKPANKMYKWVGGQSLTTGLRTFDGWIGDAWQSPKRFQHLYTETLVNIPGGYATYTPPPYMPSVPLHKDSTPVIFSNPAKLSRSFLAWLARLPGRKRFVHHQFRFERTRARVLQVLDAQSVEFICPSSHREALDILGRHEWMIDTFPYSSGLTAREAVAMGMKVKVFAGELFCERHSLHLQKN